LAILLVSPVRAAEDRPGLCVSPPEVAAALAALTGEPHPLATAEGW
jgi:hypothetical protein